MEANSFKESLSSTIVASTDEVEHLSPEDICAYHAGEKSPAEEARIQDHLAACRDCTSLLLDLATFADESGETVSDAELAHRYAAFKDAVGPRAQASSNVVEFESHRLRRTSSLTIGLAIAATVAFAVIAGGIWMMMRRGSDSEVAQRHEQTFTQPSPTPNSSPQPITSPAKQNASPSPANQPTPGKVATPQATPPSDVIAKNVVPVELYPNEALRGTEDLKTITVPPGTRVISLTLHVANAQPSLSYAVLVRDETESTVWSGPARLQSKTKTFHLQLAAEKLRGGTYQIAIAETGKDAQTTIAEYTVRFVK